MSGDLILRWIVAVAVACAAAIAAAHWALTARRINPFGALARTLRRVSDPILRPIERRLLREGGNPRSAPLWLLGLTVVGGLVLLAAAGWLRGLGYEVLDVVRGGPLAWLVAAVNVAFTVLYVALLVRVVGSWFGASPWGRWMRPAGRLTEWLLEPIRRFLPALGPLDLSPLVAWFLLILAQRALVSLILHAA